MTTMDGRVHDVGRWDLLIAHPPCTYLSNAGANRLRINGEIQEGRMEKDKILKAINSVYENLQNLQLQPNRNNVVILADAMLKLEEIHKAVKEDPGEEEGTDVCGEQTDQ